MTEKQEIQGFLILKNKNLLDQYNKAPADVQKMLQNIYKVGYRYALTDSQIIYLLEQALKPFQKDILVLMMEEI